MIRILRTHDQESSLCAAISITYGRPRRSEIPNFYPKACNFGLHLEAKQVLAGAIHVLYARRWMSASANSRSLSSSGLSSYFSDLFGSHGANSTSTISLISLIGKGEEQRGSGP